VVRQVDAGTVASMAKINLEDAAGHVVRIRRDYRKLYFMVARGDRSTDILRGLKERRAELKILLASLDGSARPTWLKLVTHFDVLEARLRTPTVR
jgi:hypothetical protein